MAPVKTKLQAVDSSPVSDLVAARRVLRTAADALTSLGEALDGEFTRAIDTIVAAQGRVMVSPATSPARSPPRCRPPARRPISSIPPRPAMATLAPSPARMCC